MRIRLPVSTLSLGLLLAVAPLSLSAQQGTLVGTVTDESSGALASGVEIQILRGSEARTAVTDDQGRYSIELPAGTYDLVVTIGDEQLLRTKLVLGRGEGSRTVHLDNGP